MYDRVFEAAHGCGVAFGTHAPIRTPECMKFAAGSGMTMSG